MRFSTLVILIGVTAVILTAQSRPDPAAHKNAMEKFRFLEGNWSGDAAVTTGDGKQLAIRHTEEVQYKLDGLLLTIEGTGRDDAGKVVFNAYAVVSFDALANKYKFRAWNSGNFVETEIKTNGKMFDWGFQQGPLTMTGRMTLDEQGRWSEVSEATLADGRKVHSVKMLLSRQK